MSGFPYQNPYPVIGGNLAEQLLRHDEQQVMPSHAISQAYQDLSALSGVNSMPEMLNDMERLMPAFMSQSHLSTLYQNNPYDILLASTRFGVPVQGGNILPDQPPGYQPGNTLRSQAMARSLHSGPVHVPKINWGNN